MDRLSAAMDEAPISQAELGRRLNKARSTITLWKKGKTEPDLATFARLCGELGVSADQLLGLRPEPPISHARLSAALRLLKLAVQRLEGEEATGSSDVAELEAILRDLRSQATGSEESSIDARSETLERLP